MMKINVTNLGRFFEIVNACESPVQLIVAEREPEEIAIVQTAYTSVKEAKEKQSIFTPR